MNFRIFLTLLISLILTIIPMPELLLGIRPPWVLLFVLYVQFFLPGYFNLISLFLLGLCMDVLLATTIGEHAFTLMLTTWISSAKARRFNFFPMGQQVSLIALYSLIYQFLILLIDAFSGFQFDMLMTIGSAVLTMFIWPWLRLVADKAFLPRVVYR